MKKRLFISALAVSALLSLSACSLFDDRDIAVSNSYNPPVETSSENPDAVYVEGVEGKEVSEVPNALCFKSVPYAKDGVIENTYKTGGINHTKYNINSGNDYSATKSSNNYDLYVPSVTPRNAKHTVVLFIHGGAWVSGLKTEVNPYIHEFARRGYVTATIKYTLLKRSMDDPSLSIFRNLDEIDACIASIKSALGTLGFDTSKTELVIGGASSGAHLTMLYSYSRGQKSALPIKFLIDAVGPVDIKSDGWKGFYNDSDEVLDAGLTADAIKTQRDNGNLYDLGIAGDTHYWGEYQTMRIANGMCGLPYSLETVRQATDSEEEDIVDTSNEAYVSMTEAGGGEDLLSATYYMSDTNKIPMICAYSGKDTIVGIAQYARLETALKTYDIDHEYFYFRNSGHMDMAKKDPTQYDAFIDKIDDWCKA